MATLIRGLGVVVYGLPSAAFSLLRRPAPAGHLRSGKLTSSAWEGWWSEEAPSDPD